MSNQPPELSTPSQPFGRHRSKINPMQNPSAETIAYAKSLEGQTIEPSDLAVAEWQEFGLTLPDLPTIRSFRLERVREMLRKFDYAGIVLYDPLNMRYACDSSNMQVWCLHNSVRYCFVTAEGPVILFEFHRCEHLAYHLALIDEIRSARSWFYLGSGARYNEHAQAWAAEIADLVKTHGGGNTRLAIDRCNHEGVAALHDAGIQVFNGEEIMELARLIKCEEEVKAMRCALATAEIAMRVMQEKLEPGISEMRLWSYLHAENIARGGEWIETRLLASGPRTNPWYQECSKRIIQDGDLVAFDTDLIGPYGMCADISRTWYCGNGTPLPEQREVYTMAYEQIQYNRSILKPGLTFRELAEQAKMYPLTDFNAYTIFYHGVGLCDEYPAIYFPEHFDAYGYDGVLEAGMVLCVESFVGRVEGGEGVKLEEQMLITEDGAEPLSHYPYEENLIA